jgi:hypothetical protein
MRRLLLAVSLTLAAMPLPADEGMWQPAQLPDLEVQLKSRGLDLEPEDLSDLTGHPLGAIVGFGFCTASFVSPEGLAVTNHHCAYGAIQYNSTAEKNLLTDGFLARTKLEELPAEPSMRMYVTESIQDVTARVNEALTDGMSGKDRYDAIDRAGKVIVAECEATVGYRCDVYSFHQGLSFQLVRQLEVRDVRLVYAPKEAIGKFGGDVDNWMWPRHTGDFSFFRAYVGPDGKPAPYDKGNVPFAPKHHLKLQPAGIQPGDFVMVTGYPGSTNRYRLAEEVRDAMDWQYPLTIDLYKNYVAIVERAPDESARLKYAGNIAGWNNTLKNYGGQIEGLRRADAVALKTRGETELNAWLEREGDAGSRQAAAIDALRTSLAERRGIRDRNLLMSQLGSLSLFRSMRDAYRLAIESAKPDLERAYGYQERDKPRLEGALRQVDRRFDPGIETELATEILTRYAALDAAQRVPELDAWLGGAKRREAVRRKVQALYAATKLGSVEERMKWFTADRAAFEASGDAYLEFLVAIMPALLRIEGETHEFDGRGFDYRPQYMQAMIDFNRGKGQAIYPDANNSLRVSYGQVVAYAPRDGIDYRPITTLAGIVEKHTGADPFDATRAQLDAIRAKNFGPYLDRRLGSVPVNFMADLDITGGNSGSPTLNGDGELVGLVFDGNIESVSASWVFEKALTRSIHVDVRYMLWVMDVLDGADHLIREMGLGPAGDRS